LLILGETAKPSPFDVIAVAPYASVIVNGPLSEGAMPSLTSCGLALSKTPVAAIIPAITAAIPIPKVTADAVAIAPAAANSNSVAIVANPINVLVKDIEANVIIADTITPLCLAKSAKPSISCPKGPATKLPIKSCIFSTALLNFSWIDCCCICLYNALSKGSPCAFNASN